MDNSFLDLGGILGVHTGVLSLFKVDDAGPDPFFLTLACLALAVKVPDGLGEGPEDVGTLLVQGIVDIVGGHDV